MKKDSKIIVGCMSWGNWGKQLSTQKQASLIEFCLEHGNSTFDHADIYGDYTTEAEFGKALIESGIKRDNIEIITKCGIQFVGKSRDNKIGHYNYSKDYIIWSAEESLRKLQTDYLDTFLLHRPSPLMHPDEIAEAITHLQKQGKIKQFGVSNFTPSQVELISDKVKVQVNQVEFSLTQHQAMFDGTLDQMMRNNIQAMSWSPLGSFFKIKDDQTSRIKKVLSSRIKKVLSSLSNKYQVTEDTLLLSWILKHPANIWPVIGTTNKQRILNANKAFEIDLELEDWFLLLTESQGHPVP